MISIYKGRSGEFVAFSLGYSILDRSATAATEQADRVLME